MLLKEQNLENTKIRFYDDCFVGNTKVQKEYIDRIILSLLLKVNN